MHEKWLGKKFLGKDFSAQKTGQSKGCGPVDGRVQKFGRTLHRFYLQDQSICHITKAKSKSRNIESGVPQGGILSPII